MRGLNAESSLPITRQVGVTWISHAGSAKLWPLDPSCYRVHLCLSAGKVQVLSRKGGVGSEDGAGLPGACPPPPLTPLSLPALFWTPLAPRLYVPPLTSGTAKSRPGTAHKCGIKRNPRGQGSLPLTSSLSLDKSLTLFKVFLIFNRNNATYLTCSW